MARATGLLAALETGRCRIAGYLPDFERQAVTWQSGAHQPDRVAAAVVAYDVLSHSIGQQLHIVPMVDIARRVREGKAPPPAWMRRRIN